MIDLPKHKLCETILEAVIDEFFEKQDSFIFNNLREAKGFQYRSYREALKIRKKVKNCIFPGCSCPSIPKSHTIQKACLLNISESNHLLTPDTKEGKTIIASIGINEASTFPGFCQSHEEIFKEFEKSKKFDSDKSYQLQIFRTICREIIVNEAQIDGLNKTKDNYIHYRNFQVAKRFKEISGPFLSSSLKSISIECDNWRLIAIEKKINELYKHTKHLKKLYRKLNSDIKSKKISRFYIAPLELEWAIPIALAGMTGLTISHSNKNSEFFLFINVIPFENKTLIILGGESKYKNIILRHRESFSNPLESLNIIERWMAYGSDHWFIKPSIWEKIPIERQQIIIKEISKTDKCIFDPFPKSIFDDLRKKFISLAKSEAVFYDEYRDFILNEERKLDSNCGDLD